MFYRRKRSFIFSVLILCFIVCFFLYLPPEGNAQPIPVPDINIRVGQAATPQQTVDSVKLLVLLALLSLLPAFLVILTSFTRIIVVLSILRSALGTQQTPPNQVLIGLALFLTIFFIAPVYQEIDRQAIM